MTSSRLASFGQFLQRAALLQDGGDVTDGELLRKFLFGGQEAAFTAIIRRHGPMVLGVCNRILRNAHDAEDAFQATFLVLVRKARTLLSRANVGNWLYGVARNTAIKARTIRLRRRQRERQASEMSKPAKPIDEPLAERLDLLDEELGRLPDRYRELLILCDLEGNTRKQAARQLGVPEGTVSSRLARARVLLGRRLTGRGISCVGGTLAALQLHGVATAAVPPTLVTSTAKAASFVAAGKVLAAGIMSANVAALMQGVLKSMLVAKLKIAAVVMVLSVGLAGFGMHLQRVAAEAPDEAGGASANAVGSWHHEASGGPKSAIERCLASPVSVDFNNEMLHRVVEDLHTLSGINIRLDREALKRNGISDRCRVSLHVERVSLKTVLNLLLRSAHFTYVIQKDGLVVTDAEGARQLVSATVSVPQVTPKSRNTVQTTIELECKLYEINQRDKKCISKTQIATADGQDAIIASGGQIPRFLPPTDIQYATSGNVLTIRANARGGNTVQIDITLENRRPRQKDGSTQIEGSYVRIIRSTKAGDWISLECNEASGTRRYLAEVRVRRILETSVHELFSVEK